MKKNPAGCNDLIYFYYVKIMWLDFAHYVYKRVRKKAQHLLCSEINPLCTTKGKIMFNNMQSCMSPAYEITRNETIIRRKCYKIVFEK